MFFVWYSGNWIFFFWNENCVYTVNLLWQCFCFKEYKWKCFYAYLLDWKWHKKSMTVSRGCYRCNILYIFYTATHCVWIGSILSKDKNKCLRHIYAFMLIIWKGTTNNYLLITNQATFPFAIKGTSLYTFNSILVNFYKWQSVTLHCSNFLFPLKPWKILLSILF